MMGKRVSREHFQPRPCSGKTKNLKNTVFIDVDDQVDDVDVDVDVVIIDYKEFMSKSHVSGASSRDRVCTPQSVISIDDDDDEESDDAEFPGGVAGGVGELDSDACSSKRSPPDPSGVRNSVHVDVVDDSGVCGKESESDELKHRKACSTNGTGGCRYGVDWGDSESESDCSDCELMDREQWEKISLKRKRSVFNDQPCYDEHASSSGLHFNNNVYVDVDEENMTEENAGRTTYSGPTNGEYVKENQSSFSVKGDSQVDGICFNPGAKNCFKDSNEKAEWETFKSSLFESTEEMQSLHQSSDIEHGKSTRSKDFSPCTQYNNNYNFCSDVTGVSGSQEACERQLSNTGSTLKTKDANVFDLNYECAYVDEGQVDCDGLAASDQDFGLTASNEKDIINEREKLKETDEYKQAMEEEWASRQRQLQIQAEEAQRLRKRKKAEKRLLDMQRRQKERIEEVRETQKKDEEVMNLKEQLRVEIQKGLNQLEMRCHDMPSLLRGLGIQVGGSFIPLPNEVHAAYKRALLKFHPDRASKTDVRAQVEAEEKFKLISRLKEKFAMTSCH